MTYHPDINYPPDADFEPRERDDGPVCVIPWKEHVNRRRPAWRGVTAEHACFACGTWLCPEHIVRCPMCRQWFCRAHRSGAEHNGECLHFVRPSQAGTP